MGKYTIYVIEGGKPTDVKAVSEDRWNMSALKYGFFWLLYHKLWVYFFIGILPLIFMFIFLSDSITLFDFLIFLVVLHCIISYQGNDLLAAKLQKNFYKEVYVEPIEADSEDEAAKKYIREQALAEQFEEKEEEVIDAEVEEEGGFFSFIIDIGMFLIPVLTVIGIILLTRLFAFSF